VTVDGKPVKAPEPARLFAFHKPAGLITAERDPAGRPTIYTALRNALPPGTPRLMPVGRLDFNTEGLLLLTNDGELKRAMELPSSGIPRTYRARTFGAITQAQLEELIEGIEIKGVRYGKIDANMERSAGRNQWIELTLTEGKNREVRRVLEHLGLEVSRLLRTSYGPFALLDLPRGMAVEVRQLDVERFRKGLTSPGGPDLSMRPQYIIPAARAAKAEPARPQGSKTSPVRGGRPPAKPAVEGAHPQAPQRERRGPSVSRSAAATSPLRGGSGRPGKPGKPRGPRK
jgi:23S rRNA pseudouridine2605 synthase